MKKDVNYYLEKGFDLPFAEYFANGTVEVVEVVANEDFSLTISYNNGVTKNYDMNKLIKKGTVFEFLFDYNNFKRVYIDDTNSISWDKDPDVDSNIVWNNKVDICTDTCYVMS
ncbi:MAG: DUF2442 domain-containing protein [Clostridia bacterium]